MFETDRIDLKWVNTLNKADEIWVPSHFNKKTFSISGVVGEKIVVMEESIDVDKYNPDSSSPLNILSYFKRSLDDEFVSIYKPKPFIFLSIFKWEFRKGWDVMIESFLKEFNRDERVLLIILTKPFGKDENHLTVIDHFCEYLEYKMKDKGNFAEIWLSTDYLSEEEMIGFYSSVDCFVLPSRGEGWGRPYVEAMSMQVPVIATNWSGQTEYMNSNNSLLLNVDRLVDFNQHRVAEPSRGHLRYFMREIFQEKDKYKEIGRNGRKAMMNYRTEQISNKILKRFVQIESKIKKLKK